MIREGSTPFGHAATQVKQLAQFQAERAPGGALPALVAGVDVLAADLGDPLGDVPEGENRHAACSCA
jgi:hypothetical protein